jgi:integrase
MRRGGHGVVPDQKLTVDTWAAKWFAARRVEPNTAAKNASHWKNHIQPRWGSWPLTAIDRLDVQTWVNDMEKAGVGPSTVHASYNLLSKMLADAVLSKKLHGSPCVEITLPTVVPPAERWLTPHEYDRIQLALANRALQIPRTDRSRPDPLAPMWQAFVALGCYSGLRCPGRARRPGRRAPGLRPQPGAGAAGADPARHEGVPEDRRRAQRWVPFPPRSGRLLWRWVGDRGSGPVFVGARGAGSPRSRSGGCGGPRCSRPGWSTSTRIRCGTRARRGWRRRGVRDEIADILGHSSTRMTGVYRHMRPGVHDRVRAAWARHFRLTNRSSAFRITAETSVPCSSAFA